MTNWLKWLMRLMFIALTSIKNMRSLPVRMFTNEGPTNEYPLAVRQLSPNFISRSLGVAKNQYRWSHKRTNDGRETRRKDSFFCCKEFSLHQHFVKSVCPVCEPEYGDFMRFYNQEFFAEVQRSRVHGCMGKTWNIDWTSEDAADEGFGSTWKEMHRSAW